MSETGEAAVSNWKDKLIDRAITTALGLVAGSVGLSLAGVNTVFGRLLFASFRARFRVDPLNEELISPALYGDWSRQIFSDAMSERPGLGTVAAVLALVALLIHVLYRRSLDVSSAPPPPPISRFGGALSWSGGVYRRHYFVITIAVMTGFLIALARETDKDVLLVSFFLIAVPSAVYMAINWKDVTKNQFMAQVCYVSLVVLFIVAVYLLPNQFGGAAWDPELRKVKAINNTPPIGDNVFAFDHHHTPMLLGTITLGSSDTLLLVEFSNKDSNVAIEKEKQHIRSWAAQFRRQRKGSPGESKPSDIGR